MNDFTDLLNRRLLRRIHDAKWLAAMGVLLACWCGPLAYGQKNGSPLDRLPPEVRQLTSWGERPDFSHDGKRLLFLSKVFGDVYEYEISTGRITPCTDHFKHHGFTRALYLSNGDIC